MFSFFRRNKNRPQESGSSVNNENTGSNNNNNHPKLSLNMQLAIERQQAVLERQQAVIQKNRNQIDVNAREQKEHVRKSEENNPPTSNFSSVGKNEYERSNALSKLNGGARALHNYDPHRDSKKIAYSTYDLFVSSRQASNNAPSHNFYHSTSADSVVPATTINRIASSSSSSSSSPINEQQKLQNFTTIAGTFSTNTTNPLDEVMARGRNRNNRNNNYNQNNRGFNSNNNKSNKNNNNKNNKFSANSSVENHSNVHTSAKFINDEENKINSSENVPSTHHVASTDDENSCVAKNSTTDNTNDNITVLLASDDDENKKTLKIPSRDDSSNTKKINVDENKNIACASYENLHQQVKRVTFGPSTSISEGNDSDDDEEEEETTISEDIFYEAPSISETPNNETQKLKILSTVTSHSSCVNENSEQSNASIKPSIAEVNDGNKSDGAVNNNDMVCAKIILSVNENCNDDDDEKQKSNEKVNDENMAFSKDSDEKEMSPLKTIKQSYKLVGDEPVALPDILDSALPDILCGEQQTHHSIDTNVANLISHASSYQHSNQISSNHPVEIVDQMQLKLNELCMKIDELEHELNIKAGTVDRLTSELESANKEGDCVRQRLRYQNEQLEKIKEKHDLEVIDESKKYAILEKQYKDSVAKLQKMQNLASNLNVQLAQASVDIEKLRQERDELLDKLTVHEKLLREILQTAIEEREQSAAKWKAEFEQLRNVNCQREETLMEDCEWKVRQMMKQCKEKLEKVEKEKITLKDQAQIDRQIIRSQRDEIKNLKAAEREVNQLRGLTTEQKESLSSISKRNEDLLVELEGVKKRLQAEIDSCEQIKRDCAYQLSERERSATNRIEIARGEVAIEWENRLMEEMTRLKMELEQVHIDDRNAALNELKAEQLLEAQTLATKFKQREETLKEEIASLRAQLETKQADLRGFEVKTDMQLMEHRAYIERQERLHQKEIDKLQHEMDNQMRIHADLIDDLKEEHKREKEQIKSSFYKSLEQIKEEFANEITLTTETMQAKHKKEMEEQWKQLVHEKENALQAAENKLRIKLEDADNKLSSVMTRHQRQLNDLRDNFDIERTRLETHDVQNSQEIDTLRRKCICLTKLFEEMRVRYERREPRVEDIARINELKTVVDSQEKDICQLTEQLRDLQLQMQTYVNQQNSNQTNNANANASGGNKKNRGKNNKNKNQQNNKQTIEENESQPTIQIPPPPPPSQPIKPQRMKPPPLIKTVIYEEENENELYEQQIREEREAAAAAAIDNHEFTVELVPESPDYTGNKRNLEEISEALIVHEHEILNQPVIPSPTPDHKNQEFAIEIISTIEPSHIQIIPVENSLDLELD